MGACSRWAIGIVAAFAGLLSLGLAMEPPPTATREGILVFYG